MTEEESEGERGGGKKTSQSCCTAGFEDGGRALSQGRLAASIGKDKRRICP